MMTPNDHEPVSHEKPWFGVRVRPRSEQRASGELARRGFEALLPSQRVRKRWADRTKVCEEPVFPGYLFARFDPEDRMRVLEAPFVIEVVGVGKKPVAISNDEINAIKTLVDSEFVLTPWPYLQAGQLVRIDAGPLAGVQGRILRSERGNPRVVVSVTMLQRSIAAEVDRDWIGLAG